MTQTAMTTVVGRMKALRKRTGLSAARLAEEMTKAGVPWKREIVANLESGRRDRLDVNELLALAAVFQVPPITLLIDSASETTVVSPNIEMPTAHVLLWMIGEQPLHGMAGTWMDETIPVRLVRRLHDAVRRCQNARTGMRHREYALATDRGEKGANEELLSLHERELTSGLQELSQVLAEMSGFGMATPPLAEHAELNALAAERGIALGEPQHGRGTIAVLPLEDSRG